MTNEQIQALRAAIDDATQGSWVNESGEGWEAICCDDDQGNAGFIIAEFQGRDAADNRKFVQCANPNTILSLLTERDADKALIAELKVTEAHSQRGWNEAHDQESRAEARELQISEINDALCKLLPGVQYMDPPDGGSVTPLEQVSRMVTDYRQQIAEQAKLIAELEAGNVDAAKQISSWRRLAKQNIEEHEKAVNALDVARQRIAELEGALNLASASYAGERERADALQARTLTVKFPEDWHFEECETEGCQNGALFSVGKAAKNLHLCEACAKEPANSRLSKTALPKRLPFRISAGITLVVGE